MAKPLFYVLYMYIQYGQQQAVDSPSASLLEFSVSPFPISPFMPFNDYVTRSVRGCGKVPFIRKNELIKWFHCCFVWLSSCTPNFLPKRFPHTLNPFYHGSLKSDQILLPFAICLKLTLLPLRMPGKPSLTASSGPSKASGKTWYDGEHCECWSRVPDLTPHSLAMWLPSCYLTFFFLPLFAYL